VARRLDAHADHHDYRMWTCSRALQTISTSPPAALPDSGGVSLHAELVRTPKRAAPQMSGA